MSHLYYICSRFSNTSVRDCIGSQWPFCGIYPHECNVECNVVNSIYSILSIFM